MKKLVFITRNILPDGLNLLRSHGFEVKINLLDRPLNEEELSFEAQNAFALITMLSDRIDAPFLERNSHLKVISNYAVGFNNIDVAKAHELKIIIGNTPEVLTEATAEFALGLMISVARNFSSSHQAASMGLWRDWNPTAFLGHSLKGKTLGIVGLGRIGLRLAQMCAHAFDMNIIYCGPRQKINSLGAQYVSLPTLLGQSDFISLHVPLNEETRHLIGREELVLMKKNCILINTARGEIIDQEALIEALERKQIYGAGLDVTTPEPLNPDDKLFQLDNVLVIPHIGSASLQARAAMSILSAQNIIAAFEGGELPGRVNPKADN